jgi:glycosidase
VRKFLAMLSALLLLTTFTACSSEPESTDLVAPNPYFNSVIYEVNLRQFTEAGTFEAFQEHLPRLKKLGVDILWLMPVQPISEVNRKGTLGSPYSVANYFEVNPEFGDAKSFQKLVDEAHKQGFKVIIDWVANHTGWDNPWITDHPDWYTQDANGNIVMPPGTDWSDVADLNYDNLAMRLAMIEAMQYWVTEYDIDGFRMDVAHSVPVEFWNQASAALHEVKDVFMLAEDGGDLSLLRTAFDTNYAWPLKDLFNRLGKNNADAGDFRRNLKSTASQYKDGLYQMVFITNHDENSWSGTEFERLGANVKNLAVLSFTVPGMPLIYSGQEIALDRRLEFFEKDTIVWPEKSEWGQSEWEQFYTKLVSLKTNNPGIWTAGAGGNLKPLHFDNTDVIAFSRSTGATKTFKANDVIVAMNLADSDQTQLLEIGDLAGSYVDWFTGEAVELTSEHEVLLEANSFVVLVRNR